MPLKTKVLFLHTELALCMPISGEFCLLFFKQCFKGCFVSDNLQVKKILCQSLGVMVLQDEMSQGKINERVSFKI